LVLTVGAATVDQQVALCRTAVFVEKYLQFIDKYNKNYMAWLLLLLLHGRHTVALQQDQ
jgi:hypothetical protein